MSLDDVYEHDPEGIMRAADDPTIVHLAQRVLASSFDNPALQVVDAFAWRAQDTLRAYELEGRPEEVFVASVANSARRERERVEAINSRAENTVN